jgi:hypothetical protein
MNTSMYSWHVWVMPFDKYMVHFWHQTASQLPQKTPQSVTKADTWWAWGIVVPNSILCWTIFGGIPLKSLYV